MAMRQEANTRIILTVGAVSSLLVLVIMFGVEAWFRYEERAELNEQFKENPNTWLSDLREQQTANVTTYGFDSEQHSWRVPVTVAMKKLIDDSAEEAAQRAQTQPAEQSTAPAASKDTSAGSGASGAESAKSGAAAPAKSE